MAKKVLICDDEISVRELIKKIVQREGYEALLAKDGDESIDMACHNAPDLIILDLTMPGKTGYDVCMALKRQSLTKDIYIIVLTGNLLEMDDKWKKMTKPDFLFTKPVIPRQLRMKLHEVLDR
ncbi:MAG: response regulator [Deltaproteobacteria bacterium]|nr:response regulator [Deltaproteobacteria bacterium]